MVNSPLNQALFVMGVPATMGAPVDWPWKKYIETKIKVNINILSFNV